ncbi:hypothetical protein E2C01_079494 [Portunus trituberculatus]|uniref:Uncharacterized protein n=1 Tax=Portunus trituberculatus TaxID=210409 RepID=A0A5B7IQG7_PORTR|nr:hypothetical protein [Portunus trituberculatus]
MVEVEELVAGTVEEVEEEVVELEEEEEEMVEEVVVTPIVAEEEVEEEEEEEEVEDCLLSFLFLDFLFLVCGSKRRSHTDYLATVHVQA